MNHASRARIAAPQRVVVALLGMSTVLGVSGCGARQPASTRPDSLAATCTPHIPSSYRGGTLVIRTVCEVPAERWAAMRRPIATHNPRVSAGRARNVFGFPGSRYPHEGGAEMAVEDVAVLLAEPSPVAGVGDARAAWRALDELAMDELLRAFDLPVERGLMDALHTYRDGAGQLSPRIEAALAVWPVVGQTIVTSTADEMNRAASGLDAMGEDDWSDAVGYLIARRYLSRDIEMLLEGLMSLEGMNVRWRQPVAVAGVTVGAPQPIRPRPWRKPPTQPGSLYIGNDAHRQIAEFYRLANSDDRVVTNYTPISSILEQFDVLSPNPELPLLLTDERRKRPDIVNLSALHIYEIKPQSAVDAGIVQARLYLGILEKAGVAMALGPTTAPGTQGQISAPGGVYIFWSPEPGVIAYQYRRGQLVPVPVAQDDAQEGTQRTWQLEPIPADRSLWVAILSTAAAMVLALIMTPASS